MIKFPFFTVGGSIIGAAIVLKEGFIIIIGILLVITGFIFLNKRLNKSKWQSNSTPTAESLFPKLYKRI